MSSSPREISSREKSSLRRNGSVKRILAGFVPLALLAGCATPPPPPEVVKASYQAPDYSPARDGNWHVGGGYDHSQRIMNDYWPHYLAVVSVVPTDMHSLSGGTSGVPVTDGKASTVSIPVLDGRGHLRQVVQVGGQSLGVYADITGNRRVGTDRGLSVALDVANASQVVRLREQQAMSGSIDQSGQQVLSRTIFIGGRYYLVTVTVQRGPGTVFDQVHALATEKATRNTSWGSPLPMEQHGGTLSDVIRGGSGHYSPDPDFHNPVDPERGGFGPAQ